MKNIAKLITIAVVTSSFPSLIYAGFDWGGDSGSCSGSGNFQQQIKNNDVVKVGEIPAGKKGVYIKLTSTKDVDIQLYDKTTGEKIIHWPDGLLNGPHKQTANYKGVSIEWSGYNGDGSNYGHEYIKITNTTNRTLVMKAYGYEAGFAKVNYSWSGTAGCSSGGGGTSKSGSGTFQQQILNDAIVTVGDIPIGINNLSIHLKSTKDVDIQLYDKDNGTKIIVWPDGILNGAGKQNTNYKGMAIEWSGYNGDGTGSGHEYIKIFGETTRNLTMKAYGYQAGYASVDYSWGEDDVLINSFLSSYFPSSNFANIDATSKGKRLDIVSLRQKDYQYKINGTDYKVAGCVPSTYAMILDYGIRTNGYVPASPKYVMNKLLHKFDEIGVLSTDGKVTSVDSANDKFIDKLNYSGAVDINANCNGPTEAKISIKRENPSLWTYNKFISKVKTRVDANKPVLIGVHVFRLNKGTTNDYTVRGGHQMLITGYEKDSIFANDTWNTKYTTWQRVTNFEKLKFFKDEKDVTKKIISSKHLKTNIIYKRDKTLIILRKGKATFAYPEKMEFFFTMPDGECLS